MLQETTIKAVNRRDLVRKRDNKPFTLYEIVDSTGTKWTTGRRDLAEEANGLIGQLVGLQGHEEQNAAGYTNYYLDDLIAGPVQQQGNGALAPPQERQQPQNPGGTIGIQQVTSVTDAVKQTYIMRQTAAKVAALISPSAAEFWANCDALNSYFNTGNKPQLIPQADTSTMHGADTQPAKKFITDAMISDPGPEPEKPLFDSDSDIPF